ncbi:hypothetical protein HDU67_001357 [Dinochytrium kinnereticum]|nr:hypothetical protein HDU67_001357 [Dinochytrium kinnereticum]
MILLAGIVITVLLFVFALRPQAAAFIYAFGKGNLEWLAWVLAVCLTLFESVFAAVLVSAIFFPVAVDNLFSAVLRIRGHGGIVSTVIHRHCLIRWHRLTIADTLRTLQSILMAITLPVNAVPIAGNLLYIAMNGYWRGASYHIVYLAMRGLKFRESIQFFRDRRASYASFGCVAMALEMIPVLNCFFLFTNVVGAALWACDMENEIQQAVANAEPNATTVIVMPAVSRLDHVVASVGDSARATAGEVIAPVIPGKGRGRGAGSASGGARKPLNVATAIDAVSTVVQAANAKPGSGPSGSKTLGTKLGRAP